MCDKKKKIKGVDLCNRTACQTDARVYMYNATMDAFYCVQCARLINDGCKGHDFHPLCVKDEKRFKEYLESCKLRTQTVGRVLNPNKKKPKIHKLVKKGLK